MKIELSVTKREAEAMLCAEFSMGWGVIRSKALQSAEQKLHEAIRAALPVPETKE